MAGALKVLAVHGVGRHIGGGPWQQKWANAIEASVTGAAPDRHVKTEFVTYDDLFRVEDITALGTLEAVGKLLGSGIRHGIGDTLGGMFGRTRAPARSARGRPDRLRWTAGMVVQWIENEKLRRRVTRAEAQLEKAHRVIEVQGNVSALLEELLQAGSATENGSPER
jgi:hypothetical protein